jgi:hypothetical protein
MGEVKEISQIISEICPKYKKGEADASHTLVYDSAAETLEPIYFFIVDLMNDFGLKTEKLVDNFTASPGSGQFSDLGQKASVMQQNAASYLEKANAIVRSVLNLTYDLKDMRTRLDQYNKLHSKDRDKQEAALLSLKQIWMDKVDMQKGNSSVKMLTIQGGFTTLIDAFLATKDEKSVNKLDLNDRVKRILKPRIAEFHNWVKESERELRNRYAVEKDYLRSQINSLKLYSRWAKPYLKAAEQLEMKGHEREPGLVKIFDTLLLELTLFGKSKLKVKDLAQEGELPENFAKTKFLNKMKRDYYSCILVDFRFRSFPQRVSQGQHFAFGGRAEITFKAYSLNQDELDKLNEEIDKSDVADVMKLVRGAAEESLDKIQEDINFFLEEKDEKVGEKEKKKFGDDSNPFVALFGGYNEKPSKEKSKSSEKKKEPAKENWYEKEYLRPMAIEGAKDKAFTLFNTYKKAHGMPTYI